MNSITISLLILLLGMTQTIAAADQKKSWEIVDNMEGIEVSRGQFPNQGLYQFKGVGRVTGTVSQLIALYADPTRQPKWVDGCLYAKLVERNYDPKLEAHLKKDVAKLTQVIYGVQDVPWPLATRDYVIKTGLAYELEGPNLKRIIITAKSHKDERYPPHKGRVRIPLMNTAITLTPINANITEVSFSVMVDPAGIVPNWVVNLVTRTVPYKTIVKTRKAMQARDFDPNLASYVKQRIDSFKSKTH